MKTARILINTPASQGGIGDLYNFKLAPSLTLGCVFSSLSNGFLVDQVFRTNVFRDGVTTPGTTTQSQGVVAPCLSHWMK
jgi:hypothetical protein